MTLEARIADLQARIDSLKARLPKHSIPVAMIMQLEELEDELTGLMDTAAEQEETTGRQCFGSRDGP